jgi:hypothetical protein
MAVVAPPGAGPADGAGRAAGVVSGALLAAGAGAGCSSSGPLLFSFSGIFDLPFRGGVLACSTIALRWREGKRLCRFPGLPERLESLTSLVSSCATCWRLVGIPLLGASADSGDGLSREGGWTFFRARR